MMQSAASAMAMTGATCHHILYNVVNNCSHHSLAEDYSPLAIAIHLGSEVLLTSFHWHDQYMQHSFGGQRYDLHICCNCTQPMSVAFLVLKSVSLSPSNRVHLFASVLRLTQSI